MIWPEMMLPSNTHLQHIVNHFPGRKPWPQKASPSLARTAPGGMHGTWRIIPGLVSGLGSPAFIGHELRFGRGPTTPSSWHKNDHHGYEPGWSSRVVPVAMSDFSGNAPCSPWALTILPAFIAPSPQTYIYVKLSFETLSLPARSSKNRNVPHISPSPVTQLVKMKRCFLATDFSRGVGDLSWCLVVPAPTGCEPSGHQSELLDLLLVSSYHFLLNYTP